MENSSVRKASDILFEKKWIARPIRTIKGNCDNIRFNLVTDDISSRSLFGGVATSLILASMLCERNNWTLRLVTRGNGCNLNDYYEFAKKYGIKCPEKVESYSDEYYDSSVINYRLEVSEKDVFFATSWWTAKALLESGIRDRIMYIIQEEETFFYPYSDDRFWCEEMMKSDKIDYIVNSKLLFDYMKNNGYDILTENGMWFEPAFSEKLYHPSEKTFSPKNDGKMRMFFYGRPLNPRNLYYFGLECLEEAVNRNIIDTDVWDIYMAGSNMQDIQLSNGYIPKVNGTMSWDAYADFAASVDLSFSLMYTPHPSYPPFDMLCSGAVVLTNDSLFFKDNTYSDNMIIAKLEKEDILSKMKIAVALAEKYDIRKKNYQKININREWSDSLKDIIVTIEERVKEGRYV
ncbi:MAG: hypothetical protein J6A37_05645 [Oscillospiraceae bacterium]|nr:hypothetical protein [Oscillospiraceae bacterium]